MLHNQKIYNSILQALGHLILSFIDKIKLTIGEGTLNNTGKAIAFCHGRGATPLMSSSMMIDFAANGYRIGGVQHTDLIDTGLKKKEECKIFREREVQVRGAEYYQTILHLSGCEEIVLMGHSYGCATILQTYHAL
jgi:hypothetical protein